MLPATDSCPLTCCVVQTTADISDEYAADIGINEWAESNNIIVLYPQVCKT